MNNRTQRDINRLKKMFETMARKKGIALYPLDIDDIDPKQSIRLKCLVPVCEYYDTCKTCPPNIPGVAEFKEALQDYSACFLVVLREKIRAIETYEKDFTAELKLADMVSDLELAAFEHGFYQALGLTVGGCKLCTTCVPKGDPCRHPYKARPSPEGFGIDITELAKKAGVAVEWPPKQYVSFLGLILV